ncbi:MAG: histidine phosphatase family protein [Bacteroidota bacterium]
MKSKTIYIVRHGQTEFNKKNMVQGRGVDAPLNELGKQQAQALFGEFKEEQLDHIYVSSLKRTSETVAHLKAAGVSCSSLTGLDEISWGNQEGKVASKEAKNLYARTVADWSNGKLDQSVGGGESPLDVMKRQKEDWSIIMNSSHKRILICMHGRAMRILLCWLLHYPLNYMDGFPHQNCAYYQLHWNGATFTIQRFNETRHLVNAQEF